MWCNVKLQISKLNDLSALATEEIIYMGIIARSSVVFNESNLEAKFILNEIRDRISELGYAR